MKIKIAIKQANIYVKFLLIFFSLAVVMSAYFQPAALLEAAQPYVPPLVIVPGVILVGVVISYKFHRVWIWMRRSVLYTNPDNFLQLAAGSGVNLLFGDKLPVRVAALMVWIPSRVVDCVDNYNKLAKAYEKWVEAIRGDDIYCPRVHWIKSQKHKVLTPSAELFLRQHALTAKIRAQRIAQRTAKLVKCMLKMSISCVDVADALTLKPSVCDRAVNEFFIDGVNAIDRIASQKEVVLEKLQENRELVDVLLKWLGTSYTSERLIDCVSTAMDGIEAVNGGVKAVLDGGNGIIRNFVQHAVFEVYSIVNMHKKIPKQFLPKEMNEHFFEKKCEEQYIDDYWMMRPSYVRAEKGEGLKPPKKQKVQDMTKIFTRKNKAQASK